MKLKRRTPCDECPFRKKSARGWLGPWTIRGIFDAVHGEGGFACHKDVAVQLRNKKKPTDEELIERVHVCVGSLQHANCSGKSYRNPELSAWQRLVGRGLDILGYADFVKHHTLGSKNK